MKKIFTLFLTGTIMLLNVTAIFARTNNVELSSKNQQFDISPFFMYSKEKTVTKNYSSKNDIPESIYYEEYNEALGGMGVGTLTLQSVSNSGKKFVATFKGTIYFPNT